MEHHFLQGMVGPHPVAFLKGPKMWFCQEDQGPQMQRKLSNSDCDAAAWGVPVCVCGEGG